MEHQLVTEIHNFETQEYGELVEEKQPLESSVLIAIALGPHKLDVNNFVQLARRIKNVEISPEGITLYSGFCRGDRFLLMYPIG